MSLFEKIGSEKRERIVEAALDEFAEHGYAGASVNRLVARLSIAKGSIFNYFGTKQGLFTYVLERAAGDFANELRQVRDETSGLDVFERIRRTLLVGLDFVHRHPKAYRLYLRIMFQEDFPLRDKFLAEARGLSARFLGKLVRIGLERGEIRADIDPEWAAFYLDALMDRFLQAATVPAMDAGASLYGASPEVLQTRLDQLMEMIRLSLSRPTNDPHGEPR